jgi:hypothetical protein
VSNVTPLPGVDPIENPLRIEPAPHRYCGHESIVLDEHARVLSCAACAAVLDPFDYLRSNARTIQRAWDSYREMNRRATETAERVAALRKEEQRMRAMVKRLQDKAGAINVRRMEP